MLLLAGMKAPFVPIPVEALRTRLAAAGFQAYPQDDRGEEVYELAHHRDPRYVVRVHSSLHRPDVDDLVDGGRISIVALWMPPDADVVFNGPAVNRAGTVEEVLDRVIEQAREAYAAVNRRRLSTNLSVQAHEISVRTRRSDLRRRIG